MRRLSIHKRGEGVYELGLSVGEVYKMVEVRAPDKPLALQRGRKLWREKHGRFLDEVRGAR